MRGQTTMDFAIGISVFVLTTAFVLTFSTGIVQPFSDTGQENTVVASRIGDTLVGGMLGNHDTPYLLDLECTTAFFDPENNDGDATYNTTINGGDVGAVCNFDEAPLKPRLGVEGRPAGTGPNLQIEVRGNPDTSDSPAVLCWDTASNGLVEADTNGCDPGSGDFDAPYLIGDDPPTNSNSVVVVRRAVSIDGVDATLLVRVW